SADFPHTHSNLRKSLNFLLCQVPLPESMGDMISIQTDTFPQTSLSYFAFRIAFQDTLERICLAQQMGTYTMDAFGFLTEVPFLRAVPPHVQLDMLAATWKKHVSDERFDASLLDESVIYGACETSARIVERDPGVIDRFLHGGPLDVRLKPDHQLASELRSLHLNLSSDGDFLMISQFEDMMPDDARAAKAQFGLDEARLEVMFEALGRWAMTAEFLSNMVGLMTKEEIVRTALELGVA
ncbi:MAG: hypothetical protein AB7O26_17795, partial [Planctomycetaceae bacterium]